MDITTSLLCLPLTLSYSQSRAPILFSYPVLCNVWGVGWALTSRLSIFLVAVLSMTRCLKITRPFLHVRACAVNTCTAAYVLACLGIGLIPFMYGSHYVYDRVSVLCLWNPVGDVGSLTGFVALYILFINLPFSLPLIPTLVSIIAKISPV